MKSAARFAQMGSVAQKGFTLLEIVVVIVVMSLLAAVVVPKLNLGKSKGALLYASMQDTGKALMNFKNDTACYPTKLSALYDKTQANESFCGIDLRDTWRQPYMPKASFDASGNLQIAQLVTGAFISIHTQPNSTGTAWILRANGIPVDILKEAERSCNGSESQTGKCTSAVSGAVGTLDLVFDENT